MLDEKQNIGEVIEKYIEIRNYLTKERKEWEELEANLKNDLEKIEMFILNFQEKNGVTSISSKLGTAYRIKKEYFRMGDWDTFIKYVVESKNYQMLEKRVAKIATKEIIENNDMSAQDIGVDYSSEYAIQIRKK